MEILKAILAIIGAVLLFLMFLVIVLRDSLVNYLEAKTEELKAIAEEKEGR